MHNQPMTTESYHAMAERHAAMDAQEWRQEYMARWAPLESCVEVAEPDPATVHECANCRHAEGGWCVALNKHTPDDGKAGCSGWPWDPVSLEMGEN